jgi:predicted nucleic-acid-binding protein
MEDGLKILYGQTRVAIDEVDTLLQENEIFVSEHREIISTALTFIIRQCDYIKQLIINRGG